MVPSGALLLDVGLPEPAFGVISTRLGGTSAAPWDSANLALHTGDQPDKVRANRELLASQLGLTVRDLTFGEQVHGASVRVVERPSARGRGPGLAATDGLVTTRTGMALVMMGADCPPVLMADPMAGVVGVAHVGRQGLVAGVLLELLRLMVTRGAEPEAITAVVGPGACGRCYELPTELADDVERLAPGSRSRSAQGTASVDLLAGATAQLLRAGVEAVRSVGGCSVEQPELLFSYRRDGVTGRHAGIVLLR